MLLAGAVGFSLIRAGLQFADEAYSPPAYRLTVATFNRRAIRVYGRVGFEPVETFGATRLNGEKEWLLMRRARLALQPEEVGGQDA